MVIFPYMWEVYYGPKFELKTGKEVDDSISEKHDHTLVETNRNSYECSKCGLKAFYERGSYRAHNLIDWKVPTCEEWIMNEALK